MAGNKNSGRKTRLEELTVTRLAGEAITEYYGSMKEGFMKLLKSEDTALIKFVWEHAAGKPREKVDVDVVRETIQIIKLPDNGRCDSTDKSA